LGGVPVKVRMRMIRARYPIDAETEGALSSLHYISTSALRVPDGRGRKEDI